MIRFLHRLNDWLRSRTKPRPAALPACPPWSDADRDAWAHFLSSITGRKLLARARSMEAMNAIEGAKDVFHTSHSAGKSNGFSEAVNWFVSLTQTKEEAAQETYDDRRSVDESLDDYVQRMSP